MPSPMRAVIEILFSEVGGSGFVMRACAEDLAQFKREVEEIEPQEERR